MAGLPTEPTAGLPRVRRPSVDHTAGSGDPRRTLDEERSKGSALEIRNKLETIVNEIPNEDSAGSFLYQQEQTEVTEDTGLGEVRQTCAEHGTLRRVSRPLSLLCLLLSHLLSSPSLFPVHQREQIASAGVDGHFSQTPAKSRPGETGVHFIPHG